MSKRKTSMAIEKIEAQVQYIEYIEDGNIKMINTWR